MEHFPVTNGERDIRVNDPLYASDRGWYELEKDANPNKAEGAVLVEYAVTATPTGRNILYRNGERVEPRFNASNTKGEYCERDLDILNSTFESIMDANADTWADSPDRDVAYKTWQDATAELLLARYDLGERGNSLLR